MGREWHVFDLDLLAEGYNYEVNWDQFKNNWVRLAAYLARSGRPTILCGTMMPESVEVADQRECFSAVHYAALTCDDVLEARLRARGGFSATEAYLSQHLGWASWLRGLGFECFDTTRTPPSLVARQVHDWVLRHGNGADAADW